MRVKSLGRADLCRAGALLTAISSGWKAQDGLPRQVRLRDTVNGREVVSGVNTAAASFVHADGVCSMDWKMLMLLMVHACG